MNNNYSCFHLKNRQVYSQAFNGRGTPPTKTVLRGSNGIDASNTKSASDSRHGRI